MSKRPPKRASTTFYPGPTLLLASYINPLRRPSLLGLLNPTQKFSLKSIFKIEKFKWHPQHAGRSHHHHNHHPPLTATIYLPSLLKFIIHLIQKKLHLIVALQKLNPQCNFEKLIQKQYNTYRARYTSSLTS